MESGSAKHMPEIAAFTMEIGLESEIPTYSGGLGVLAGDTAKEAADMGLPFAVVTLAHRQGYFRQAIGSDGRQTESPAPWEPERKLEAVEPTVEVTLEGRTIQVRAWRYTIRGVHNHEVPVLFLDTDVPGNRDDDRAITNHLYGGDERLRLRQEAILGIGGVRMLRALGKDKLGTFHMNEGHAALLAVELLGELGAPGDMKAEEVEKSVEAVKKLCVFTTHTPVAAGHDRFTIGMMRSVLGEEVGDLLETLGCVENGKVNMTHLALRFARFTNGVALRHGGVSREMFPGHRIHAITNGVHANTWVGEAQAELFDRHLSGWRKNPFLLRHAVAIPTDELRAAHAESRDALFREVHRRTGRELSPDRLTMVFARRAAPYKRAALVVSRPDRLREVVRRGGPLQIIYAGKAHPRDEPGKELIRQVVRTGHDLGEDLSLVYLEDYDMRLGGLLTAGSDLWLNMPRKPLEASGTSGMKAAMNGIPSLSILDGWWIEGHVEGVTGWAVDESWRSPVDDEHEFDSMVRKLEDTVLPLFHGDPEGWAHVMRSCIALNGAHFQCRRMLQEYVDHAFLV
ncbi:MAG: alpha-glucan family phosphorylase [Gemmatimonadales bacterium]|nr:MAG: alpha-glucan family phosphorylase [Gemmatimonadales bacterium]